MFSIYFNICNIVLKDGWDIDLLFNMSVMVLKCPQGVIGPCAGTRIGLEERMIGVGGVVYLRERALGKDTAEISSAQGNLDGLGIETRLTSTNRSFRMHHHQR